MREFPIVMGKDPYQTYVDVSRDIVGKTRPVSITIQMSTAVI